MHHGYAYKNKVHTSLQRRSLSCEQRAQPQPLPSNLIYLVWWVVLVDYFPLPSSHVIWYQRGPQYNHDRVISRLPTPRSHVYFRNTGKWNNLCSTTCSCLLENYTRSIQLINPCSILTSLSFVRAFSGKHMHMHHFTCDSLIVYMVKA